MVSRVPDRFGAPGHHIDIYFADNLDEMLAAEQRGREQKAGDSKAAGKTAFKPEACRQPFTRWEVVIECRQN
jgi:hypothetical protein